MQTAKFFGILTFSAVLRVGYDFQHLYTIQFIHSVVHITTGPKPLPKRVLHRMRSSASSVNLQYPLLCLRSSSSYLRLPPRAPLYLSFNYVF